MKFHPLLCQLYLQKRSCKSVPCPEHFLTAKNSFHKSKIILMQVYLKHRFGHAAETMSVITFERNKQSWARLNISGPHYI